MCKLEPRPRNQVQNLSSSEADQGKHRDGECCGHDTYADEDGSRLPKVKEGEADMILAREVVKGTDTLVLRDAKGVPVWSWRK